MGFDAVFAGNIPTADQRPDAIGDQLFACQYGEDSRHRRGGGAGGGALETDRDPPERYPPGEPGVA